MKKHPAYLHGVQHDSKATPESPRWTLYSIPFRRKTASQSLSSLSAGDGIIYHPNQGTWEGKEVGLSAGSVGNRCQLQLSWVNKKLPQLSETSLLVPFSHFCPWLHIRIIFGENRHTQAYTYTYICIHMFTCTNTYAYTYTEMSKPYCRRIKQDF